MQMEVFQQEVFTLYNYQNQTKKYYCIEESNFGAFESNSFQRLIFLSEIGINPKIHVLNFELEKVDILYLCYDFELSDMKFDHINQWLYLFSQCPEYQLKIFDWQNKSLLIQEQKINLNDDMIKFIINPLDRYQLLFLEKNKIRFLQLKKFLNNESQKLEVSIDKKETIIQIQNEENLRATNFQFTDFSFDQIGQLIVSDNQGNIYLLNLESQQKIKEYKFQESYVKRILINRKVLMLLLNDNTIKVIEINEENQNFNFNNFKDTSYEFGNIQTIIFNESYRSLLIFDDNNQLYRGVLPLENLDDSEEKEDDGSQDENFDIKFQILNCYHQTSILHIEYQENKNLLFSIDDQGYIIFWNLENFQSTFQQKLTNQKIVSVLYLKNQKQLLISTVKGLLKIFQLDDENKFEMIYQYHLFENDNIQRIQFNKDWNLIMLQTEQKIILIKNKFENFLNVYGYIDIKEYCLQDLQLYNRESSINLLMLNLHGIVINISIKNLSEIQQKIKLLDQKYYILTYKRIDDDLNKLSIQNNEQKFYCTGEDLVLKIYELPIQNFEQFNKAQPIAEDPVQEKIIIDTPVLILNKEKNNINCFTQEGTFVNYNIKENTIDHIDVFGYQNQQVTSYYYNKKIKLLISGNEKGCIYINSIQNYTQNQQRNQIDILEYDLESINDNVNLYSKLIELRYLEQIKESRDIVQNELKQELQQMQQNYTELLNENMQQDDLKKLDYSEFCIDKNEQAVIKKQENKRIEQIRYEAKYEQCRNDLIHYRIKEKTYDQIKYHLNTITSLQKNLLITNYSLKKQNKNEDKIFNKIKMLRKFEVREKNWLLEQNQQDDSFIKYNEIFNTDCNFVINGIPGRPQMILTDFEQREINIQDYLEEQRKKREKQKKENNNLRAQKKKFQIVNRRIRNKKRLNAAANVKNIDKKNHLLKQQSQGFHSLENVNGESNWLLLYSSIEITTNFTSVNQIYFIRNIIQSIKREFNRRFEELQKQRLKVVDIVNESNSKMKKIYAQLEKEDDFFIINKNILENVEKILEVQKEEIHIKKYLTKEEKRKIEEQKRIDEEKLRAIHQDDSNVRALKMMMNNTLEVKKENILQKEIDKEEWMQKPKEEMTEEEKIKYNEYLEKQEQLNAEAEKLRKILNQEIKKLKTQTQETIKDFDHKASILFMQKLEYDYRVLEQELIVLKIKKNLFREKIYKDEIQKTIEENEKLVLKIDKQMQLYNMIDENLQQIQQKKQEKDQEIQKTDNKTIKQLYQIIQPKDDFKKKKQIDENQLEKIIHIKGLKFLHDLDPNLTTNKYYTIDRYIQDPMIYNDIVYDFFSKKVDQNQIQNEVKKFFNYLKKRNDLQELSQEIEDIQQIKQELNEKKTRNEDQNYQLQQFIVEEEQNQIKERSNIDLMIRLPSEQVEIQTNKVIPLLDDTILIQQKQIESLNDEIFNYGNQKVTQLGKNLEEKQKVEADLIEHKILKKEIKEAMVESSILTRLKVSKKLQAALNKKNENLMELEERNTKKQIDKIIQSTQKNLQAIKQKENQMKKEIKFLSQENNSLVLQGGSLQESVNQRKEIFTMIFNNSPQNLFQDENQDNKNKKNFKKDDVAYKKIMQLAHNRKLFDVAKKLAHEIEKMMTELKNLKERTYPNINERQTN